MRLALGLGLAVVLAGCTQYATRPSADALAPNEWTPTMNMASPSTANPSSTARRSPSSVEERLRELQKLQEQGVITAEEAKRKRAEILEDL